MLHKRTAFYPCCSTDFAEPYDILNSLVDQIIFCDISISAAILFKSQEFVFPKATFWQKDALEAIKEINQIDVFFYRGDSAGEGGSGLFFFGDNIFPLLVEKFNPQGALIISDGSNARGSNWRKIKRKNGVTRYSRLFKPALEQKYVMVKGNGSIHTIEVFPI